MGKITRELIVLFGLVCVISILITFGLSEGGKASLENRSDASTQAELNQLRCSLTNTSVDTQKKLVGLAANQRILHESNDVDTFSELMNDVDIDLITRVLRWDLVEPEPGVFLWDDALEGTGLADETANKLKNRVMFKLAFVPQWASSEKNKTGSFQYHSPSNIDDWQNFVTQAVRRYGYGQGGMKLVRDWEIWNEPNSEQYFKGSSAEYVVLLNTAYDAIKAVDPSARVWAPSIILWQDTLVSTAEGFRVPKVGEEKYYQYQKTWEMYYAVINEGKFDGFSMHSYGELRKVYNTVRAVKKAMQASPHADKLLMVSETNLEIGYPWNKCPYWSRYDEAAQAALLTDFYTCLYDAGADTVMWFPAVDRGYNQCPDGQLHDGVMTSTFGAKQALGSLRLLTSNDEASEMRVKARGIYANGGWPELEVSILLPSGEYQKLKTFVVNSSSYLDYVQDLDNVPNFSEFRLKYINDSGLRDVYIDSVTVGSKKAVPTYSTGSWDPESKKCKPGIPKSRALNCNGYFQYRLPSL